jgi:hypothetical protein
MEERSWWTGAAVLALTLAFAIASTLVWATRGRSYPLLRAKLRLGGLLLGASAVAAGCFDKGDSAMVMCYDAGWDSDAYHQPDLELDQDSMDFGAVPLGSSVTLTLTIDNVGNAPLSISALSLSDEAGVFGCSDTGPIELSAGGQAQVELSFTPGEATDYSATLSIYSDDPNEPSVELALLGAGLAP